MTKNDKEGGFISHLTELRTRLINSFIFLFVFFIICYFFAEYLYGFLVEPYAQAVKGDGTQRRLRVFRQMHGNIISDIRSVNHVASVDIHSVLKYNPSLKK